MDGARSVRCGSLARIAFREAVQRGPTTQALDAAGSRSKSAAALGFTAPEIPTVAIAAGRAAGPKRRRGRGAVAGGGGNKNMARLAPVVCVAVATARAS